MAQYTQSAFTDWFPVYFKVVHQQRVADAHRVVHDRWSDDAAVRVAFVMHKRVGTDEDYLPVRATSANEELQCARVHPPIRITYPCSAFTFIGQYLSNSGRSLLRNKGSIVAEVARVSSGLASQYCR